jgi:hypothetical protein
MACDKTDEESDDDEEVPPICKAKLSDLRSYSDDSDHLNRLTI